MTDSKLFWFGVALAVGAVVGGGLKLANVVELPVLKHRWVRIVLGVASVVFLVLAYTTTNFRVTSITVRPVGNYRGACPNQMEFEGHFSTKGGEGDVAIRLFDPGGGFTSGATAWHVSKDGTYPFTLRVPIARSGAGRMVARVTSPTDLDSAEAPFTATCTNLPPPQAPQQTPTP